MVRLNVPTASRSPVGGHASDDTMPCWPPPEAFRLKVLRSRPGRPSAHTTTCPLRPAMSLRTCSHHESEAASRHARTHASCYFCFRGSSVAEVQMPDVMQTHVPAQVGREQEFDGERARSRRWASRLCSAVRVQVSAARCRTVRRLGGTADCVPWPPRPRHHTCDTCCAATR